MEEDKNVPSYLKETAKQKLAREEREQEQNDEEGKKFVMLNTRMLDNHWDKKIHNLHWKAPGKQPHNKYVYTKDQGLGYKIENKFEKDIEDERSNLSEKKKGQIKNFHDDKPTKFRPYKELDNLNEDEVVITIEYCTNCSQHNSTTRHDEQKYLNQALSLQKEILKCFPIITVFLKPNVYDERDKSVDTIFIRQRVGAFDVQIAAGKVVTSVQKERVYNSQTGQYDVQEKQKQDLKTVKGVLHSKLKSGKWPDHPGILSQIRNYMQQTQVSVQLTLQDFDIEDIEPEQYRNPKINKLFDIEVILKPRREKVVYDKKSGGGFDGNDTLSPSRTGGRPVSAMSRKSVASRPKSAMSQASNKSRNQSMYGGSQTQEYDTSKDQIVLKTEPNGTVVFENVPYDVYNIQIDECNEFKQLKEVVDIFEFAKNEQPVELNYNLKHLNLTFLKIMCTWGLPESKQETQAMNTVVGQDTKDERPKLIPRGPLDKASLEVIPIRDGEEIIDETYDDNFNGSAEVTLLPGKVYKIRISKPGFQVLDQCTELQPGQQELEFCVEKLDKHDALQQEKKKNQKPADRGNSGRPDSGRKNQDNSQRPVSGARSLPIFIYDGSNKHNMPIKGAQVIIKERKLKMEKSGEYITDENGQCVIQLQHILEGSLNISHPDYIGLCEEYGPGKFDLKKQTEINFPLMRRNQEGEIQVRVLTNSGEKVLELAVCTPNEEVISEGNNGQIEVDNSFESGNGYLSIKNIQQLKGIYRIYAKILNVQNLSNQFVKVFVIFNNKQICVDVPKNISTEEGNPSYWDLGFISAPNSEFIEINAPSSQQIQGQMYLQEYQNFLNYIKSSKVDLKQLLGFNQQQKLEVDNDVFQKYSQIQQSLEQYGYDPSKGLAHLFANAKSTNGMYSFSKLNNKFTAITTSNQWEIKQVDFQNDDDEEYQDYN